MKKRVWKALCRYVPSAMFICFLFLITLNPFFLYAVILQFVFEALRTLICYKGSLDIATPTPPPGIASQPYHPSVQYFLNGWNGYKYWMAFTPMPKEADPYPDRWENPCIVVSNDGIHWDYCDSVIKPLDDLTEEEIANKSYFSDPDLIYLPETDSLRVYYRLNSGSNANTITILFRESTDGLTWSERSTTICSDIIISLRPISPSFVWEKDGYIMWFVKEQETRSIYVSKSDDGQRWENAQECILCGKECDPWHIDCQLDGNKYILTIYEWCQNITIWESDDGVSFVYVKLLLSCDRILGSFYNKSLYRTCLTKTDTGYKAFFSARNIAGSSVGIMEGTSISSLTVIDGKNHMSWKSFILDFIDKYTYCYKGVLRMVRFLKKVR